MFKNILHSIGFISVLLFSSCELERTAETTPQIYFWEGNIKDEKGEKLEIRYLSRDTLYYFVDTLETNRTISFPTMVYGGGEHNVTEFSLEFSDPLTAEVIWNTEIIDQYILNKSDYETGRFFLDGTENTVEFPFELRLKEPNKDFRMYFTAFSDGTEKFNRHNLTIRIAVREED